MAKETLETPPPYVDCTPEEWAAAKAQAALNRLDPLYSLDAMFAASALDAKLTFGNYIDPVTAAEFRDVLDAKGYKVSAQFDKRNAEQRRLDTAAEKAAADKVHADWVNEQSAKRTPFRFRSLREAAAHLSMAEYGHYCLSQEGQMLGRQENGELRRHTRGY